MTTWSLPQPSEYWSLMSSPESSSGRPFRPLRAASKRAAARRPPQGTPDSSAWSQRLTAGIAVTITAAWAVGFIADLAIPSYDPPASVHGLMVMVVGAIFGAQAVRRPTGGQKEEEPDE